MFDHPISNRVMTHLRQILQLFQLGYGCKRGAEAIVHAVRLFLSDASVAETVLLKLNFKNAFNNQTRLPFAMCEEVSTTVLSVHLANVL